MSRLMFLGSAVVTVLSACSAPAQPLPGIAAGAAPRAGSFGGGFGPVGPTAAMPILTSRGPSAPRAGFVVAPRAGFYPRYPYAGYYSPYYGYGGGYTGFGYGYSGFGYGYGGGFSSGYYSPYFASPRPVVVEVPVPQPAAPPAPVVELSGEYPATLTLVLPAEAEVWQDEKAVSGTATEQTLTSPVLRPGETYTFHVKARWKADGQTYEYVKDVTLGPGARSRLQVLSGTPVSGK